MALLLRYPYIKSYNILAIRKLWQNNFTPTTYHLLKDGFGLYYPRLNNLEKKARVCFFVSKRFKPKDIKILFYKDYFMTLTTNLSLPKSTYSQYNIHIHNLYKKPNTSNSLIFNDLTFILSQIAIIINNLLYKATIDHIIIGDFNIHHPSWGCKIIKTNNRAPQLLEIIDEFNFT